MYSDDTVVRCRQLNTSVGCPGFANLNRKVFAKAQLKQLFKPVTGCFNTSCDPFSWGATVTSQQHALCAYVAARTLLPLVGLETFHLL
jgi:hypothetical protein